MLRARRLLAVPNTEVALGAVKLLVHWFLACISHLGHAYRTQRKVLLE